jgi:uncharacterized membrane protein
MEHTYLNTGKVALAVWINAMAVPVLIAGTVGGNMDSFVTAFRAAMRSVVGTSICQSCEVEVASVGYDTARDSAMVWLGASAALAAVGATQKGIRRLALIGAGVAVVQAAGCDAIAKAIDRATSEDGGDDPDEDDTGPAPTWN